MDQSELIEQSQTEAWLIMILFFLFFPVCILKPIIKWRQLKPIIEWRQVAFKKQ